MRHDITTASRARAAGGLAGTALLLAVGSACAGEPAGPVVERIEPDRRDFTTGTGIVPAGTIQVEGGVAGERGADERLVSIGELTIRIPLAEAVEVHVGLPSFRIRNDGRRRSGFDDAALEVRYRFVHGDRVDLAVQAMSTLPTGTRRVAERRLQPGVVVASRLDLGDATALVLDVGATRASDDGQRFTQTSAAASFRVDVAPRVSAFVEAYAFNREAAGGEPHRYVAAGAVFFADRDTAFDARIGRGLHNGRGTAWLVGAGLSRRF